MSTLARFGELVLLGLPVVAATALVGAMAVWTAGGRGHWFLRASVLVAVAAMSRLAFPPQGMLGLAIEAVTVVLGLKGSRLIVARYRAWQGDSSRTPEEADRYQCSLLDLLLGTAVVAMVAGLLSQVPASAWADAGWIALGGALFGGLTLATVSLAHRQQRQNAAKPPGRSQRALKIIAIISSTMLGILYLSVVAGLYLASLPTTEQPARLPDSPGYRAIVKAAALCPGSSTIDVWKAGPEELAGFVQQNAVPLAMARQALEQECHVMLQYTQTDLNRNLDPFRDLAWAMVADARLAEVNGRYDEAVRCYLDALRLARAIAKEGIVADAMQGWIVEDRAVTGMWRLHDRLTKEQTRTLLDRLRRLEAEREPFDTLRKREMAWQEYGLGIGFRMVGRLMGKDLFADSTDAVVLFGMRCQARMRTLICTLAVHLRAIDHGSEPEALAALVPDYLDQLPTDPFTRQPLRYRNDAKGHLIYSVGPDKKDDGGRAGDSHSSGDILIEDPR